MQKNRKAYKVILVGDPRVGKTSIRMRYLGKGFKENYIVTLGADFAIKRLENNKIIQVWDLAGQPVYQSVREGYYKGAEGIILVFDVTSKTSFSNMSKWLNEVINKTNLIIPMILVGNKSDLRKQQASEEVLVQDAENYAKELSDWSGFDVTYLESSALNGSKINDIFINLIEEIENHKSVQEGN